MKLLLAILMLGCCAAQAATIVADSAEVADVQTAVNAASTGDTVQVPSGVAYWTSSLLVSNKGITLEGAGIGNTVIFDVHPTRSTLGTIMFIQWTNATGEFRITGFDFRGSPTNTSGGFNGALHMRSTCLTSNNASWRIDSCQFSNIYNRAWYFGSMGGGLIDSNIFYIYGQTGGVFDSRYGLFDTYGDISWADNLQYGTVDEGVYFEGNVVYSTANNSIIDCFGGTRYVARFNTVTNAVFGGHGTESTQRARGIRWKSVYGNVMYATTGSEYPITFRSGTGVIFSNTFSGPWPGVFRGMAYRMTTYFLPYGGAWGTNGFDTNYNTVYDSGVLAAGTSNQFVVDTSKSWTANQWQGYSIWNTNTGDGGVITSNSATGIRISSKFDGSYYTWSEGDVYQILRVYQSLDQPGVGKGDLLSGGGNSTPPTPYAWPNQEADPIRFWDNTGEELVGVTTYNMIGGLNYTNTARAGYTSSLLQFPHPLVASDTNPPAAPTGLQATAGDEQVSLSWNGSAGASSYNVKRSTTQGSGHSTITNTTATSLIDLGLSNGTTYYYVVSATNSFGESANSSEVNATPQDVQQTPNIYIQTLILR